MAQHPSDTSALLECVPIDAITMLLHTLCDLGKYLLHCHLSLLKHLLRWISALGRHLI